MFSWQPALSVPESEVNEQSSWLRCGEGVKMMPGQGEGEGEG